MVVKGIIKKGQYFDSVTLMIVAKNLRELPDVSDSSVVMATSENKAILKVADLLISDFKDTKDSDLLVVISAEDESVCDSAILKADELLQDIKKRSNDSTDFKPKSLEAAKEIMNDANLALISVSGKFAYSESKKAIDNNMNVMLFSDNVTISEEVSLKKAADKKNLLVMGPDCGTAIINRIPLAFANYVNLGEIGVVAASGTGLQEVTTLISNYGFGITQALGTGGRDIKEEVGGISFLRSLSMLAEDESTKVILMVAKPPHPSVLSKIGKFIEGIKKPTVAVFLGADQEDIDKYGIKYAETLEDGAKIACELTGGTVTISEAYKNIKVNYNKKCMRALYSGGTFCYETQLLLKKQGVSDLFSNAPCKGVLKLQNSNISQGHTILDLGEDEFTQGRPHPMIDFSLRNQRILEEVKNPDVSFLIIDLVIGYGANMNPMDEFIPTIRKARVSNPEIPIISFVTGTDNDPQEKVTLIKTMKELGVHVVNSNKQAAILASNILKG